jgi:hypothetical protein
MNDVVAQHTYITQYLPLATKVQAWPAGLKDMKKYDVEKYLLVHQQFANDLNTYKEMLTKAKTNPAMKANLPTQKKKCQGDGKKFETAMPNLREAVKKLSAALSEDSRQPGVTQEQKQAVLGMLNFLKKLQGDLAHDWGKFDVVNGMIKKIEEGTPS